MSRDRDVRPFDERSSTYETGARGKLHHRISDRTLDIALGVTEDPVRVLDVGCGTGYLLRQLASRRPGVVELAGIDPAGGMIEVARALTPDDGRFTYTEGFAERLPYPDAHFDLVVSTTSFHHWEDQSAGVVQCARVLETGGRIVLTDLFSMLFLPTLLTSHRGRARTVGRATALFEAAGFRSVEWRRLEGVTFLAGTIMRTVVAHT